MIPANRTAAVRAGANGQVIHTELARLHDFDLQRRSAAKQAADSVND